jgi:hypothetical protein
MVLVGGMVVLAASGTAAAIKLSQKDAQRIEEHTGLPPADLEDADLNEAMDELGIQSQELTEEEQAALAASEGEPAAAASAPEEPAAPPGAPSAPAAPEEPSYLEELEKLAGLRDQGIISDEDFEAKKQQLLGI